MLTWLVFGSYAVFFLTEILLNRRLRSQSTDQPGQDKNSITLIWVTIPVAIFVAIFLAHNTPFQLYHNVNFVCVGVALIFLGIALRFVAIYTLGRFFTVDVTIRQGHALKRDGLYHYLRHPSYAASLLSFIGMGYTFNNWLSLLVLVAAVLAAFRYRIRVEERALIAHFGEEYLAYKRATPGLLPFIW